MKCAYCNNTDVIIFTHRDTGKQEPLCKRCYDAGVGLVEMELGASIFRVIYRVTAPDGKEDETHVETNLRIAQLNNRFFVSNANVHEHYQGQGTSPDLAILDYLAKRLNHRDT